MSNIQNTTDTNHRREPSMTSHLPPSLTRNDSLHPGGSPAERKFDQLQHAELAERLRRKTMASRMATRLKRKAL